MAIKLKGLNRATGKTVEVDLPKIIERVITAEEIAEAWYEDYLQAPIGLDEVKPGDLVRTVWAENNSLDQGADLSGVISYLSSASSLQDILDNGENSDSLIGGVSPNGTYRYGINRGTSMYGSILKSNAKFNVVFEGDAAPTTGEITIKIEKGSK